MVEIKQFEDTIYGKGYGTIAKEVMINPNLSIGAKCFYSYLCSYAFSKNEAYPTVERIIKELNISENSFRKYRKELEKSGYIKVEFKTIKGVNRNLYTIISKVNNINNSTPSKNGSVQKKVRVTESAPSKSGTQIIQVFKEYNNNNNNNKEYKKSSIYKTDEFNKEFKNYLEMRKKRKKVATDRAIELIIQELEKVNNESIAIEMLQNSIKNGWIGVFIPKKEDKDGIKNYKPNSTGKREVITRDYYAGTEDWNK